MVSRKRGREEMEADIVAEEPTLLTTLRNMWQFSNLAQYIYIFGDVLKIDKDFDIEVRLRRNTEPSAAFFTEANHLVGPGE